MVLRCGGELHTFNKGQVISDSLVRQEREDGDRELVDGWQKISPCERNTCVAGVLRAQRKEFFHYI